MRILVTGCGAPGGPGIIKELVRAGHTVFGTDSNELAGGQVFCKGFKKNTGCAAPLFINDILKISSAFKINIIIPLVTGELLLFSKNKNKFLKKNIIVLVADYEALKIINNKGLLYHCFKKEEFIPRNTLCKTAASLLNATGAMMKKEGRVVVKPAVGNGSRGVRIISKHYDGFKSFLTAKPGDLNISYSHFKTIIKGKRIPAFIVSEYLPGKEYTCDVIFKNGEAKIILVRERILMRSGISITGQFVDGAFLKKYIEKMGKHFCLNGPIGFQFKLDKKGKPKLLEINPRLQGSSAASRGTGLNFINEALLFFTKPNHESEFTYKPGLIFTKYYDDVYIKR